MATVAVALALAACSSKAQPPTDDAETYESELRLAAPRYLGEIASGETKTSNYSNPPRYRAFGFTGKGGQEITLDVRSNGDAVAWLTTSKFDVLALNDDASSKTLDSKIVYTVPAGTPPASYRVVFRDYDHESAAFTVTLSIKDPVVTCSYGGKAYKPGDTFKSTDDCNTCSCTPTGAAACTKLACVCNPEVEPWREYVGTVESCGTIRFMCTADRRIFHNDCGCGCEKLIH